MHKIDTQSIPAATMRRALEVQLTRLENSLWITGTRHTLNLDKQTRRGWCSCPSFRPRNKTPNGTIPCKHLAALAVKLGLTEPHRQRHTNQLKPLINIPSAGEAAHSQ